METGFYYLQSRYYDPTLRRFINSDSYQSTGQGIVGTNMFAYCNNCPVAFVDHEGGYCSYAVQLTDGGGLDEFVPINGQMVCEYSDMAFGFSTIGNSGCAVIGLYNALGIIGKRTSISHIVEYFEEMNIFSSPIIESRVFGVMPGEIEGYLSDHNIPHKIAYSLSQLESLFEIGGTAIVMRWNEKKILKNRLAGFMLMHKEYPNVLKGAHTMAVTRDKDGSYVVYNRYSDYPEVHRYGTLQEFMGTEVQFIAAFYLG